MMIGLLRVIMTAFRARHALLSEHLNGFAPLLPKVEKGDVRAIHRARVASRRLRELIPVLELDADTCSRLLRDLRRVTRALGPVRELDVLIALVEARRQGAHTEDPGHVQILGSLSRARAEAFGRAQKRLGADLRRVVRHVEGAIAGMPQDAAEERHWYWVLDARISRRAKALETGIAQAGPIYAPSQLHAVRIAVKKLRYAIELSRDALGVPVGGDLRALRGAQELLGRLHDRQVLIVRVLELQASQRSHDRRLSRSLDQLMASLEAECRVMHARYVGTRDRLIALCERLRADATSSRPSSKSERARTASAG
jgi:CHAD domain-containing protein